MFLDDLSQYRSCSSIAKGEQKIMDTQDEVEHRLFNWQ